MTGFQNELPPLFERGRRLWLRLRQSRVVENVFALYLLTFANYVLPLITVPYTVRVLRPAGYGLGAFAVSFAGFFAVVIDYGFNLTATRAVSVHRNDPPGVSKIATQVILTKTVLLVTCSALFWVLISTVPKLRGNNRVMWMGYLQVVLTSFSPFWLYQGLEKLRFSSRVNLVARVTYVPLLFLFVHQAGDVWKWMVLQASVAGLATAILWSHACLRLGVRWVQPRLADLWSEFREGFSLFASQAAVKVYTGGNTFVLGMFTNVTTAGYYSAAEKVVQAMLGMQGPITQAVYPHASHLAASSRRAALRFTRLTLLLQGGIGLSMTLGLLLAAPWFAPILLGPRFIPSIRMMQILSPLPFLIALSNVLGIQIMVPFKRDVAFTMILVGAGFLNLGLAVLLAPRFQGNGMAMAVTCSELWVTAAMFWYLTRLRLSPLLRPEPEAATG
jgi:PST family polysaccharide transporter